MNKALFCFLCLLAIATSLKMSHNPTTGAPAPTGTTGDSQPPSSPEELEAYGRMFAFVQKDKSLSQAMSSGASPNEQQLKKLMNFMINDPFFQDQMIDDFLSKPENSWMNNVSKNAQVRFLKIITSVPLSKISDAKTMAGIVKRLLSDKEIGPALKKQYGNNITADLIASSQGSLQSSMSSAQHKLSKY